MASKRDRAFAWFGVILFAVTSSALTIAVIIQLINENKKPDPGGTTQSATTAETSQETPTMDNKEILQGTKLASFTPGSEIKELNFTDTKVGTGEEVKPDSTIEFHYTGAVAKDGTIFQSSYDAGTPATYPLSNLIAGWQKGIPGMKAGGERRLFIPWQLAYGEQGNPQGGIPAKADLVFDIVITAVK